MGRFNLGDFIEITTRKKKMRGIFIPSQNKKVVTLKLTSGYNIGIQKKEIKSIKLIRRYKKRKRISHKIAHNKNLKKITIIHTGGTISSRVSYDTGAVSAQFTPEELLYMLPELSKIANINSRLIGNMFSEDMRFAHYNLMAKHVEKEIKAGAEGIIITHGTDTLGYSAAALSFMLEDLPIPVMLVAAQRSSDRSGSDAFLNLTCAVHFMTKSNFAEVAICMHETSNDNTCVILPGTKTRKMHSSRRDAFKAVNTTPFARIDREGKIQYVNANFRKKDVKRKLKVRPFKENVKVGIIKAHPNMFVKEFQLYEKFDGLVIEGTGLTNFPLNDIDEFTAENKKIANYVKKLAQKIPIIVAPQTLYGRINMNVYSTGRKIKDLGVLGDYSDMLPETTFIKLAWLLSNYPKGKVKELLMEDLRGELTKRSAKQEFLDEQ